MVTSNTCLSGHPRDFSQLTARLLHPWVASECSLGSEEQGQAWEQSLKDKEMLAGMYSKKLKDRGWEVHLGLEMTMGSLPTLGAASI